MMKEQFEKLWATLEAEGNAESEFQFLYKSYSEPHRYYHNLNHIQSCLNDFRQVSTLTGTPGRVELAIWYHDVVYDVKGHDNEQKSADIAFDKCKKAKLSDETAKEVHGLILITKHNMAPETVNQKIMVDVDLAVLGKPPEEYHVYEEAIRKEYAHVPEADFRKSRIAILRIFLERPSIYLLAYFQKKYQAQAVINIRTAIAKLE